MLQRRAVQLRPEEARPRARPPAAALRVRARHQARALGRGRGGRGGTDPGVEGVEPRHAWGQGPERPGRGGETREREERDPDIGYPTTCPPVRDPRQAGGEHVEVRGGQERREREEEEAELRVARGVLLREAPDQLLLLLLVEGRA